MPAKDWWRLETELSVVSKIFRSGLALSTIVTQFLDSVFDGLYFIKLKSESRIVHVPGKIHFVQGFLLYTCKF